MLVFDVIDGYLRIRDHYRFAWRQLFHSVLVPLPPLLSTSSILLLIIIMVFFSLSESLSLSLLGFLVNEVHTFSFGYYPLFLRRVGFEGGHFPGESLRDIENIYL